MKNKKIRIIFFIFSFGGGGIQKIMINLLNGLKIQNYDLHIIVLKKEGPYLNLISNNIKIHELKCNRVRFALFPFLKKIYELKPDIVFSSASTINFIAIIAKLFTLNSFKLMIRQAGDINEYSVSRVRKILIRFLYPSADAIIALTYDMKNNLVKLNIPKEKIKVIYNGISLTKIDNFKKRNCKDLNKDDFNIISIGSLNKIKNFDLLLESFKLVRDNIDAKLYILGEGELKRKLINKSKHLGISEDTFFVGYKENPYKYLYNSDVFVQTSYCEGFSNALLEAMACGLPIITTFNPDDIIKDNLNGFSVNFDKYEISEKILMFKDISIKEKYSNQNISYSKQFSFKKTLNNYRIALEKLI